MNIKTTIVLLVLLLGVGAYVFVTRDKGNAVETKHEEHTLLDVKKDSITSFDIVEADGKEIAAQKSRDADGLDVWKLTKPVNAVAEPYKVSSLLDALTSLKSTEQVNGGGLAYSVGLDHPKYTVVLNQNKTETKLEVGDPIPVGDGLYVRVGGRSVIDVVSSALMDTLNKPANSLRKDRLFDTAPPSVQQLTVTRKDGSLLVMEKNARGWQIVKPQPMPADGSAVEDMASTVINMQPVDFVDDPSQVMGMGLGKPQATVVFSTVAPSTQPAAVPTTMPSGVTVTFGNYDDINKKNVFAQLPDGNIVKVPASVLEALNKKPLDLRDKSVVDIDATTVEKVVVAMNQAATTQPVAAAVTHLVTLQKRPKAPIGPPKPLATLPTTGPATMPVPELPKSEWVVAGPQQSDADDSKVATLLGQFHPLKAEKFLEKFAPGKVVKTYTVTIFAASPALPTLLTFVDPGNDANLIGSYNGLTFEVLRSVAMEWGGDFGKAAAVK